MTRATKLLCTRVRSSGWMRARKLSNVKTSVGAAKGLANEALQTLENPSHPLSLARAAGIVSAASAAILAKLLLLPPDRPSVFKGEPGAIKHVVWSSPFPLERVKAIGGGLDATINDVLVAAVAGGQEPDRRRARICVTN